MLIGYHIAIKPYSTLDWSLVLNTIRSFIFFIDNNIMVTQFYWKITFDDCIPIFTRILFIHFQFGHRFFYEKLSWILKFTKLDQLSARWAILYELRRQNIQSKLSTINFDIKTLSKTKWFNNRQSTMSILSWQSSFLSIFVNLHFNSILFIQSINFHLHCIRLFIIYFQSINLLLLTE